MFSVHDHNREAWDELARQQVPLARPAGEKEFAKPQFIINPFGWVDFEVRGRKVLCLAAGGGKHSVLFAAAGADTTVVDISPAMLDLDRKLAAERGFKLNVVEASMDNLASLPDAHFDLVVQPVSTCYVPNIAAVYREAARVTAPGGLYISQHKQPVNLQTNLRASPLGYALMEPYYRSGPLPPVPTSSALRESGTLEFMHRWDELLGGLCRAGFVIEDTFEPKHGDGTAEPGSFAHRCWFVPPYLAIKARRKAAVVEKKLVLV
jgi:SAM-dependent methyltransferase